MHYEINAAELTVHVWTETGDKNTFTFDARDSLYRFVGILVSQLGR